MAIGPGIGSVSAAPPSSNQQQAETVREAAPRSATSPWPLRAFFGIQIAAAIILMALWAPQFDGNLPTLVFFIALNVAAQLMPIVVYKESAISMGFVVTLAIIIVFGAPGVIIAAPVAALAQRVGVMAQEGFHLNKLDHIIITNGSRWVLIYASAALAFSAFADHGAEAISANTVMGAAAATAVSYGLSLYLLMVSTRLRSGRSFKETWERNSWVAVHYVAMGVLGVALTASYLALGVLGVLAFVTPIVMMRITTKQYVAKTEENVTKLEQQNQALQKANIEVRRMSDELRVTYDDTLEALVGALDARDQETKGHSVRVSRYMLDIAREMGVKEGSKEWVDMARGSLLHDVGKIGVSDNILLKPGKLTEEEWTSMRKHPEIGYNMLRSVKFLQGPAELILAHHERWDGKGYPKGLHEDEIPLGARIFTVVDTFDSMTSDRPYRKALTTLDALNEILRCGGTQFDPRVVEAFMDIYETWVEERDELHRMTEAAAA